MLADHNIYGILTLGKENLAINFEGVHNKSRYLLIDVADCVMEDLGEYW
jgi:hypothetical protein